MSFQCFVVAVVAAVLGSTATVVVSSPGIVVAADDFAR